MYFIGFADGNEERPQFLWTAIEANLVIFTESLLTVFLDTKYSNGTNREAETCNFT